MGAALRSKRVNLWRRLLIGQVLVLGSATLVYRLAGHRMAEFLAQGRSIGSLDRIFAERPDDPLRPLVLADALAADLIGAAVLLILAQFVLYLYVRRSRTRPQTVPVQDPRATFPAPAEASGDPEAPAGDPEIPTGDPEAPAMNPEKPAGNPETPAGDPVTPMETSAGPSTPPLSALKRTVFTMVILLIPIAVLVVPFSIRYAQYLGQLEKPPGLEEGTYTPPPMPGLTPEQLLQLGGAHRGDQTPLRSYLNHPQVKPSGTIRIGVFGDSYAEGQEAALEHDLSTHLERLLEEGGAGEVEVINFGMRGYGVHQASLLWEYLGRMYDLDYTILMPFAFHIDRDTSFLKEDQHFGPLHGVYAAEGDSLRYVPVIGEDRLDSCRRYFSALQPLRYWRYDTRVPMAFRPLLPSPHSRRGSPFYYRRDVEAATVETYLRLFRRIASESGPLIVLTDDVLLPRLIDLRRDGIYVLSSRIEEFQDVGSSVYRAPHNHPSGNGYEIYAMELAALLLGAEKPVYRILRVSREMSELDKDEHASTDPDRAATELTSTDGATLERGSTDRAATELTSMDLAALERGSTELDAPDLAAKAPVAPDLATMERAVLSIRGEPIGHLRHHGGEEFRWWSLGDEFVPAKDGVSSLAALVDGDALVFIPLTFPLREGDEVSVEWTGADGVGPVAVGEVTSATRTLGQITIDWSKLESATSRRSSFRRRGVEPCAIRMETSGRVGDLRVLIGGKTALIGESRELGRRFLPLPLRELLLGRPWLRQVCAFRPTVSDFLYFRSGEGQYVSVADLGSGQIDLTLQGAGGESHVLPFLGYEVVDVVGAPFDPPFPAPLERSGPMGR